MKKRKAKPIPKSPLGKMWYFIWEDDSIWSWFVNVALAFILIKFIVYPALGFMLSTSHPIVAVVSGSMEHRLAGSSKTGYQMCGNSYAEWMSVDFDVFFEECGHWYIDRNITKAEFSKFPMRNGFNKGDIIFLKGKEPKDIKTGDVVVFVSHSKKPKPDPIIHRVVDVDERFGRIVFQTKGDHNAEPIDSCDSTGCINEVAIGPDQMIGTAMVRVPYLGYVKLWAVDLMCLFGDFNFCMR